MRILTFLFSLLVTAGVVALTYFAFTQEIQYLVYMLSSTAISIVLAFIAGHFMYRAHFQKRRAKHAEVKANEAELRVHELETIRLQQESALDQMRQSTMSVPAQTVVEADTIDDVNGDTQIITIPQEK